MVQYKKEEIKEKIDSAALTVFAEKGYNGTKILDIAKKANISVGNIYRYYKSKEELFYSVVPDSFLVSFKNLLVEKISIVKKKNIELTDQWSELWFLNDELISFIVENRERTLIMFNENKGTKYKNAKTELVNFLIKTVKSTYAQQYNQYIYENKNHFVIKIIYENLINMTLSILEEAESFEELMKHLKSINLYHMFGITGLLE